MKLCNSKILVNEQIIDNIYKLIIDFNDGTLALVIIVGIVTVINACILGAIMGMKN